MVARQIMYAKLFRRFTLLQEHLYLTDRIVSRFSTSSQVITYQKAGKDEPIKFSKSRAKLHTVDDTLGITKSKNSKVPIYLGLGLFTLIIYFGFIRKEPTNSNPESLEELLDKIRVSHEEKLKNQTMNLKSMKDEASE